MNVLTKVRLFHSFSDLLRAVFTRFLLKAFSALEQHRFLAMKQRTRRQLQNLTADQLKDIGITQEQADEEMKKGYGE